MRSVLVASLLVILAGCATSHVMVGNARPAISPSQVKIYLHPPEKYEEIAILDTSSQGSFSFTQQGKMDVVVERLKAEAAKLGANGILLESTGDRYGGSVSTGAGTAAENPVPTPHALLPDAVAVPAPVLTEPPYRSPVLSRSIPFAPSFAASAFSRSTTLSIFPCCVKENDP